MPDPDLYSTEVLREVFSENNWRLQESEDGHVTGILQRYIEHGYAQDANEFAWAAMKTFLLTYTASTNTAASVTVSEPMVSRKPQPGLWRGGPVRIALHPQTKRWRIIQTLFKADGAIQAEIVAARGCRFRVSYQFFHGILAAPTIPVNSSGVEYTGRFNQDKDSLLYYGYIEKTERLYQNIAEFLAGQDTFETTHLTKHLGVRDGDITDSGAAVTIPAPSAAADGTLLEIDRQKNGDCTQDVGIQKKTAVNVPAAEVVETDDAYETRTENQENNAAAAGATPTPEAGKIKITQSWKQRFKARWNVRTIIRACKAISTAASAYVYEEFLTSAEITRLHQAAELTPPTVGNGTAVQDQNEFDQYGKWTNKRKIDTAVNVKDAVKQDEEDAFELRAEVEDANESAAGTVPPNQTAGIIKRVISAKQRFKARWNVRTITRTAKAVTAAVKAYVYGVFENSAETVDRHQPAALEAPVVADGTAVQDQSTLDEFSKWENRRKIDTAVNVPAAEVVEADDAYETRTENQENNATAAGTTPTPEAGKIKITQSLKQRFKNRWNVRTIIRTCKEVIAAIIEYREDLFSLFGAQTNRNQATAAVLGDEEVGKVKRVVAEENAFAKWDNRSETETAKPVAQAPYTSRKTDFTDETTTRKWHQASVPNAAIGEVVAGQINRFGLFDFVVTAETPVTGLLATSHTWNLKGDYYHSTLYTEWFLASPIYPDGKAVRYYRYISTVVVMQRIYVHTMAFKATLALALAEIHNGETGSEYRQLAPGLWMTVKVTRNDAVISTTNLPDPYADLH
jgi:hypothetical protein